MMKNYIWFLFLALTFVLTSCNSDEKMNGAGLLRIGVNADTSVITKADGDDVEITKVRLLVKTKIDEGTGWSKEYDLDPISLAGEIELAPGTYELTAIAGDGTDVSDGFSPCYKGSTNVTITAGNTSEAKITCTLATVKVSVSYASNVKETYKSGFKTEVGSLSFTEDKLDVAGYLTAKPFAVNFLYKDNIGGWRTIHIGDIETVNPREYYHINIAVENEGEGAATITIKVGKNTEDIKVEVTLPEIVIETLDAENVEYTTATLKGTYSAPSGKEAKDPVFQYREKGTDSWTTEPAKIISGTNNYTASVSVLKTGTEYEYCFLNKGNPVFFQTKDAYTTSNQKNIGIDEVRVFGILNDNSLTNKYFEYKLASASFSDSWSSVGATLCSGETNKYEAILPIEKGKIYQYRFGTSKTIQQIATCTSISVKSVSVGADYAKVEWDIQSPIDIMETDKIIINYKYKKQGDAWGITQTRMITKNENGNIKLLTGLEQDGTYCIDDDEKIFTTLKNASFDTWIKGSNKAWYANAAASYDFWATGNEGVRKANKDSNTEPIVGRDGVDEHAAKLTSISAKIIVFGFFAAGNLYTGSFNFTSLSDAMDANKAKKFPKFGQNFSSRPTGLKGWYKYSSTDIDQGLDKTDSRYGTKDKCQIYAKLFNGDQYDASTINSTTFIAEGEFSSDQDVIKWTPFEFDLTYHDLESIPTKIAVVATSSIYGGDFVGALNSILYVDDFELIYDYTKLPYKTNK